MENRELQSKWQYSNAFGLAKVIKWWGVWPPSKFFEASVEDQAFAIVTYESEMGMSAWDSYVEKIKHDQSMANLSTSKD